MSYNRPKFCPFTSWYPDAVTFISNMSTRIGYNGLFVDSNNTIFVLAGDSQSIKIWKGGSLNFTQTISYNTSYTNSLFAMNNGDLYIDNGIYGRVDKLSSNTIRTVAFYVDSSCIGLFVDANNSLYCSMQDRHKVVKNPFGAGENVSVLVAGEGTNGSAASQLCYPSGIFVDDNFDLYVADTGNDRVQRFELGNANGTTMTGSEVLGSIALSRPLGIVLDSDDYLFILDNGHNRIIGSSSTGFRCIAGCSSDGSAANQLQVPTVFSFDSYGNLFVNDWLNGRIQKFLLATNSCRMC